MTTFVYVIGQGERDEGVAPILATDTLARAKAEVFQRFDVQVQRAEAGAWVGKLDGCDEVWIHRIRLEGAR
jgi:hypothetical protein